MTELTDHDCAHLLKGSLDQFKDVLTSGVGDDTDSPSVVVVMKGHKNRLPGETRRLAERLDFEVPEMGDNPGENCEYGMGLFGDPRSGEWTRVVFTQG